MESGGGVGCSSIGSALCVLCTPWPEVFEEWLGVLLGVLYLLRLGTQVASAHWQKEPPKPSREVWDLVCLYLLTRAALNLSRPLYKSSDQRVRLGDSFICLFIGWFIHSVRPDDLPT